MEDGNPKGVFLLQVYTFSYLTLSCSDYFKSAKCLEK